MATYADTYDIYDDLKYPRFWRAVESKWLALPWILTWAFGEKIPGVSALLTKMQATK
jgi:hypothetical protein